MKKLLPVFLVLYALFLAKAQAQTPCNPQFTWAPAPTQGNSLTVSFTNTTSFVTPSPSAVPNCWISFGDNVQQSAFFGSTTHNYAAPGTYTVKLYMTTYDSLNQLTLCFDSVAQQVTVNYPCNAGVSAQEAGGGAYTFTATMPPPVAQIPGVFHLPIWHYGDNSPADTGNNLTHTYALSGIYTVTASVPGCPYPYTLTVHYIDSTITCDTLSAGFSYNNNNGIGNTVSFYNTSVFSPSGPTQNLIISNTSYWLFGDGGSASQNDPAYTYGAPGSYTVTLINSWIDSLTQILICSDSMVQQVTVGNMNPLGVITGAVIWDTVSTAIPPSGFKVWLISHDVTANTLTAMDSVEINPWGDLYTFWNAPAGEYLVKAAALSQPAGVSGLIPTYHDSSLYWSGAATIIHSGGLTEHQDIWMQNGITTSGPGFIGGNISQGAGKGTGTGVPGLMVFLRNGNQVLRYAYTDENGDYTFDQVPEGSYTIYPEAINYSTTPSALLAIQSGQLSADDVDFEQTEDEIKPKNTTGIADRNTATLPDIYPNPARNTLFIRMTGDAYNKAILVNMLGQKAAEKDMRNGMNRMNTASLARGIYYLNLSGKGGARSVKIVLQ